MSGYAFIDFETTGFSPQKHDKVVEVGIHLTTPDLEPDGTFETLINPMRDIGPTSIHGITATDVVSAPSFAQIAPALSTILHGRILVAHNLAFDMRFLDAELDDAAESHDSGDGVCTLALARAAGLPLKLVEIVSTLNITRSGPAHSASSDAAATAEILRQLDIRPMGRPFVSMTPPVEPDQETTLPRQLVNLAGSKRQQFQTIPNVETDAQASYLDLLSDSLADGVIDDDEYAALRNLIEVSGFSSQELDDLHFRYLNHVVESAAEDGTIDQTEWSQIFAASKLLDIDLRASSVLGVLALASRAAEAEPLTAGQAICLTGECEQYERQELEAAAVSAGFTVKANVSKKLDVLICSDASSQSGKARKARDLGIAVTTYPQLLKLLKL